LIRFSPSLAKVLETKREFKVGEKVRVNLHHGKIEDVVGLDLTALIDTRQVVE